MATSGDVYLQESSRGGPTEATHPEATESLRGDHRGNRVFYLWRMVSPTSSGGIPMNWRSVTMTFSQYRRRNCPECGKSHVSNWNTCFQCELQLLLKEEEE